MQIAFHTDVSTAMLCADYYLQLFVTRRLQTSDNQTMHLVLVLVLHDWDWGCGGCGNCGNRSGHLRGSAVFAGIRALHFKLEGITQAIYQQ